MINLKNLTIIAFSTIALKFLLLFIPNDIPPGLWNTINSFVILLYSINFILLFNYLKKGKNITLKSYPIILICIWGIFSIIDSFIPYYELKANLELTNFQALLFQSLPPFIKLTLSFIGELTLAIIFIKSNEKALKNLGVWLATSIVINSIFPFILGGLLISFKFLQQYFNIIFFLLGIMSLFAIGKFYLGQIKTNANT